MENYGAVFAVNQFSGLNQEEWKTFLTHTNTARNNSELPALGVHEHDRQSMPDELDWQEKGAVTPVKNQ